MRAAPLARSNRRSNGASLFAPLHPVPLVEKQWRIGMRIAFLPTAHRWRISAQTAPAVTQAGTTSTDQRNHHHGARDIAGTVSTERVRS